LNTGARDKVSPVSKHAAFLRAVNLGPTRKISSTDLCSVFEKLGFQDVSTFRTSGNVVFEAGREPPAGRIEEALAVAVGAEVPIFLRTASELLALADHEPFPRKLVDASNGKLQVVLLSKKPTAKVRKEVLALATDEDRLALGDRELYWLPSGGIRDAALNFKAIEKLVGPSTMRTKGTIEQLAAKYFATG
jgi:uncharacterized protein (DUF1697 family)